MSRVRIGIAGLGRLGKRHAANLAVKVEGAELAAACSPVAEEREWARTALGVPALFDDYRAMLAGARLDAVFLVTPTTLHAEQIVDGLDAGLHVFCEKPLALERAHCERVVEAAARRPDRVVTLGFVRRYDRHYRYAHAKIEAGAIGRPILFRGHTADMNDTAPFQVAFARTSGGIFLDMAIHDIDLARWFLGAEVEEVLCVGDCYVHEGFRQHADADNATALYRFGNGAAATITVSRTARHGHDAHAEIVGTEGTLVVGRPPGAAQVEIADRHGVRTECVPTFYERFEEAFLLEAQAFVDCVRHGRPPRCTVADAVEATRIAEATTASFRQRRAVSL